MNEWKRMEKKNLYQSRKSEPFPCFFFFLSFLEQNRDVRYRARLSECAITGGWMDFCLQVTRDHLDHSAIDGRCTWLHWVYSTASVVHSFLYSRIFFSGSFHIFSHDWRLSIYSHCPQAYRSDGLSNRLNSTNQVLFFNTTIHFRWPLLHSPYWIRQRVEEFLRASPFQVNRYEDIHLISKKRKRNNNNNNKTTTSLSPRLFHRIDNETEGGHMGGFFIITTMLCSVFFILRHFFFCSSSSSFT